MLFNSLCEGNSDGTLFTVGKMVGKIPTPHSGGGGGGGGIKPAMDNLLFQVLLNSISTISGQ